MACVTGNVKNLGLSNCNEFPRLLFGMIETPDNFVIPAATITSGAVAVLAYLQAALLVSGVNRIWYWPGFNKPQEDSAEAEVYQDSALKIRQVRKGNQRWKFFISENLCIHKAMQTHKRTNGRVILLDVEGALIGTAKSNGDFAGLSLALLNPEKLKWATDSEVSESTIYVALSNSGIEFDKNGLMFDGSTFVNDLYRIVDVALTVSGTPTATTIIVDIKSVCDQTPISGFVVGDFIKTTTAGATQTITTAVESITVPGRYTLSGTGWTTGFVNLTSATLLSIKAYESSAPLAVL